MAKRASPSTPRRRKARAKPKLAVRKRGMPAKKTAPARKTPAGPKQAGKAAVRKAATPGAGRKTAGATPIRKPAPGPPARKAASRATRPAPQRFTVSHLREEDFQTNGLRPYARYRDLGIAEATGGLARAHVIRMIPPVTEDVRQRHAHTVDLQLVYVLKGWMKNEFAGHGVQMMEAGSCWLQPPGIAHTVLDYSDDLEVLEVIVPADFDTSLVD